MATSVEFGPGIRLVAPTKSRNSSLVSHCRRSTNSWRISAMCAAGPPNEISPSFRNTRPNSARLTGSAFTGDAFDSVGVMGIRRVDRSPLRRQIQPDCLHERQAVAVRDRACTHSIVEGQLACLDPILEMHVGG